MRAAMQHWLAASCGEHPACSIRKLASASDMRAAEKFAFCELLPLVSLDFEQMGYIAMEKQLVCISCLLSFIYCHHPDALGLKLAAYGRVDLDT